MPFKGEVCELVSISQGYADDDRYINWPDEWHLNERLTSTERYEFYHVLWIEWQNGIAYRRALGRVMKEVWQRQELERIELILG
jgi:hypothetical protein